MARNRAHPRISITKLAEYLVATAGRRHSILVDQKFPSAFKVAKWTEAYPAIADVIAHGGDARAMTTFMTYAGDLALGESFADGVSEAYVPFCKFSDFTYQNEFRIVLLSNHFLNLDEKEPYITHPSLKNLSNVLLEHKPLSILLNAKNMKEL